MTCSVQATFLTGTLPREHGIVGNGWYFRDLAQVMFWRQSNQLVRGEKVWETARRRDPSFTCAKLFWWYNMYSTADWAVTPRPIYPGGRPQDPRHLHAAGGAARAARSPSSAPSRCSISGGRRPTSGRAGGSPRRRCVVDRWHAPTLLLVYLPHLDYNLQRLGASDPRIRPTCARSTPSAAS